MDDAKFEKLVENLIKATRWLKDCEEMSMNFIYKNALNNFNDAKTELLSEIHNLQHIIDELECVKENDIQ
jgi:hypothetical protein